MCVCVHCLDAGSSDTSSLSAPAAWGRNNPGNSISISLAPSSIRAIIVRLDSGLTCLTGSLVSVMHDSMCDGEPPLLSPHTGTRNQA